MAQNHATLAWEETPGAIYPNLLTAVRHFLNLLPSIWTPFAHSPHRISALIPRRDAHVKENQLSSESAGTKLLFPFSPSRVQSWEGKSLVLITSKDIENMRRVFGCGNISDCKALWGARHSVLLSRNESKPEITNDTLRKQTWPQQTSLVWHILCFYFNLNLFF